MPKRRMTAARRAQIKRWQSAGVKARKVKKATLYHFTEPAVGRKILKQGFKFGEQTHRTMTGNWDWSGQTYNKVRHPVWFSDNTWPLTPQSLGMGRRAGQDYWILQVRVPKRNVHKETEGTGRGWFYVPEYVLRKRKVRNVSPKPRGKIRRKRR